MKTYFTFGRNYSKQAFGLKIDYSLEEIRDTLALLKPEPTPKDFLQKFSYKPAGMHVLEDMLANNMGWYIFSARVAKLFFACRNSRELELLPLPKKACELQSRLGEYRVLGIKREIACLDMEESDLRWDTLSDGRTHISAIYECVLKEKMIPDDVDIFRIAEYPAMPVISSRLARAIADLRPTGLVYDKTVRAITHQE